MQYPVKLCWAVLFSIFATVGAATPAASGNASAAPAAANVTAVPPMENPRGVALDAAGNLYVVDANAGVVYKIPATGKMSVYAGWADSPGSNDGPAAKASFSAPAGVAVDAAGNVYVADTDNNTIRKITPDGIVSTLAGKAGEAGSDDGPGAAARFSTPTSVAVDAAGNVYVADNNNFTVRKITPAGNVTTLAGLAGKTGVTNGTGAVARFANPRGIAVDGAGNVYVADETNNDIRKITSSGNVTTLAGSADHSDSLDGVGAAASFAQPHGVAVDAAGNVYVADTGNNLIRKITPAGVVTTLAGKAGQSGATDGAGGVARFAGPRGLAVDAARNVYVADSDNTAIRKTTPAGVVSTLGQ
jgi:sugar lactone lactonase YvrE